jgi:hypothetical protein
MPAALTLRRVLRGFLPSIKSKKVRVGGTIRLPFTTGVPVNAVVGRVGPFSQAGFWIELGGEAKANCAARDDTGEGKNAFPAR